MILLFGVQFHLTMYKQNTTTGLSLSTDLYASGYTVLINLVKNLIDKAQVSMVLIQHLHIPNSRYHHI